MVILDRKTLMTNCQGEPEMIDKCDERIQMYCYQLILLTMFFIRNEPSRIKIIYYF